MEAHVLALALTDLRAKTVELMGRLGSLDLAQVVKFAVEVLELDLAGLVATVAIGHPLVEYFQQMLQLITQSLQSQGAVDIGHQGTQMIHQEIGAMHTVKELQGRHVTKILITARSPLSIFQVAGDLT